MNEFTKEIVGAALSPREPAASLTRNLPEHRQQVELLHDDGQDPRALVVAQGGVTTEKSTVVNVGIGKVTVVHKDESYRNPEALRLGTDEVEAQGASWRPLKATQTLKTTQAVHGENLVAYDARKVEVSVDLFNVEIYSARSRSARALVRG